MAKKGQPKPKPIPPATAKVPNAAGGKKLIHLNFEPIFNNIHLKSNQELLQDIVAKRNNTPIVTLLLKVGVQLNPGVIRPLFDVLKSIGKVERLNLFLSTSGGTTEVPWRIVSLLREFCDQFTAIIPFTALSAGTHIALGANDLIMNEISTLGPVDPSTSHPLLPRDKNDDPIPVSVEDLKNCINFISQQLKDQNQSQQYSPSDMTNIVGKLFDHIEPLAIGAVERAYGLSRLITKKVLETHLDPEKDKDKIERIVNKIGGEYFSHAFPITVRDVEKDFQLNVQRPSPELFKSIWDLYEYYNKLLDQQININFTVKDEATGQQRNVPFLINVLGVIDSLQDKRILMQVKQFKEGSKGEGIAQQTLTTQWIKPHAQELPSNSPHLIVISHEDNNGQ